MLQKDHMRIFFCLLGEYKCSRAVHCISLFKVNIKINTGLKEYSMYFGSKEVIHWLKVHKDECIS